MDTSFICSNHLFASIITEVLDTRSGPFHTAFLTCHTIAILTFIISTATGNLSQVDKLWSILPTMYAWMCVVDTRTMLMACLSTCWSVRLTYNFSRRGGYSFPPWRGEEDYRWEVIRRGSLGGYWKLLTRKWIMVLFNIVFISWYQNVLLMYIATPSFVAWSVAMKAVHCQSGKDDVHTVPLNTIDILAVILFTTALFVEAAADKQQYNFQEKKKQWKFSMEKSSGGAGFASAILQLSSANTSVKEYKDGFCQSGLFAVVRKPAYAAEQVIWISYYLFSIAAMSEQHDSQYYWNWSGGGCILLILLFRGSGWLTERISSQKYPAYRLYQTKVPLYVPRVSSLWHKANGKLE